jgi:hypothetical protein
VAISRAMCRLLRIRNLQEQTCHLELESALGELNLLEQALKHSGDRDHRGRLLIGSSARTGELADRLSGIEESRAAGRHAASLRPRIADAEEEVATLRERFLARRVERRQAETLIDEAAARDAVADGRRSQQALDDWHGSRRRRSEREAGKAASSAALGSPAGQGSPAEPELPGGTWSAKAENT